jgi:hypothetical protein
MNDIESSQSAMNAEQTRPEGCCDRVVLSTCCPLEAKPACCGQSSQAATCGCQAGVSTKR